MDHASIQHNIEVGCVSVFVLPFMCHPLILMFIFRLNPGGALALSGHSLNKGVKLLETLRSATERRSCHCTAAQVTNISALLRTNEQKGVITPNLNSYRLQLAFSFSFEADAGGPSAASEVELSAQHKQFGEFPPARNSPTS